MSSIRIAAAQSISLPGDVAGNVATHCKFIRSAASAGVDALVFPELSLCGYEPALLRDCVLTPDDAVLGPLRELSMAHSITVIVGAPVLSDRQGVRIGAFVYFPSGATAIYCKQYLHAGEDSFAEAGELSSCTHRLGDETFSLAVCADTTHEQHALDASAAGASIYLAGVLWADAGYTADASDLQRYAARYRMATLAANHGGPSGGYACAGKSAIWAPGGELVAVAPGIGNHLVVASRDGTNWSGEVFDVSV